MVKALYVIAFASIIMSLLCLAAALAQMNDPHEELEDGRITET